MTTKNIGNCTVCNAQFIPISLGKTSGNGWQWTSCPKCHKLHSRKWVNNKPSVYKLSTQR